jgi:hypothetical protein
MTMTKENTPLIAKTATASLIAAFVLALSFVALAQASVQVDSFTTSASTSQAGGHPDLITSFSLDEPGVSESAENVTFQVPEGLFGNPNVLTPCSSADFALDRCPPNSQAGLATVHANYEGNPDYLLGTAPIYRLAPGEDQTALFALVIPTLNIPIQIPVSVRTDSDYGLDFKVSELTQTAPLAGAELTFWGFPASPDHDAQRFDIGSPGNPPGCPGLLDAACIATPTKVSIPNYPLIDNPTICTGQPLITKLDVQSYQDSANPTHAASSYPPIDGCEHEIFKPVLFASLTTNETDSPSGLSLDLRTPQFLSFSPSPSQLRSATVTLPPELTINPDAADGQSACSEAQANFGTKVATNCPDTSKIGTFLLNTPSLDGPLVGSIYIGEPKPNEQYRLFLAADGFGIHAKLTGVVHPNPKTGQVTIELTDLPQVPIDDLQVHLFASDRGLMATPTHCTLYPISGHFFPWNSALPDLESSDNVSLDSGPNGTECSGEVRPFHPRLAAGTSNPLAGAFSNFTLKLDRDDGDQYLGDLNFKMPPGFTGSLRGISYCPEAAITESAQKLGKAEQATPSCPSSSQVGTSNVAAGPGAHPFHAVGKMYLAGPFKGAPLSLVAITPALAGPYDYGVVVVRVALHINPLTAQVSAVSDTVPSIIGGIPIRMRSIQVNIDKPNFTINPTNCSPFSVDSQGIGDQGTVTDFSSYFNVVNCATLPFKPKMSIKQLGGKRQTKRSKNPSLRFDLNTRPGDANLKSIAVTLPKAFAIDQRHLGNICSKSQLAAEHCAGRQAIGTVSTETPLLDQPLSGPAYAVSGYGVLPHIAFILGGQVTIIPEAESSSVKGGHLKTVVPVIPDAPIGHFRLTLFGKNQGYLQNTKDLCAGAVTTTVEYSAQNGKALTQRVRAKTACGGRAAAKHKRARR